MEANGSEIVKRFKSMNEFAEHNWKNLWQECADWAMPLNNNINTVRIAGAEKPPQRLIDSLIEANLNFASGYFSHMFTPNTIWAKVRHPLPKMMEDPDVATYFEEVSRILHQVLAGSNFAQQEFESLLCMGCFGTSCLSIEEDSKKVVRFRNHIVPSIRIAENYLGQIDTVGRTLKLDARQAVQQFGRENLKKLELDTILNDADEFKDTKHEFIHMVSPREDYDKSKKDVKNKPFSSVYVHVESKEIVKESGFDYNPYLVARFTTGNDEIYGRGPTSMVLGTARRSNSIERSVIISAEQHTGPQWLVTDDDSTTGLSSRANAVIKWKLSNGQMGKPERLDPNGNPGIGVDLLERYEKRIEKFYYNHLFNPLEDYRNMTAFEANERRNADLMSLAPFTSRYTDEKATPMIETLYTICESRGLLPDMPQALKDDPKFEVNYVGRMSLATKSFEVMGALDTIRVFAELSNGVPQLQQAFDNLEVDKLFMDSWFNNSGTMNALKDSTVRDDERKKRAKAQKKRQQIEDLPKVADGVYKASQIDQGE